MLTREVLWTERHRAPVSIRTLATVGGVVFNGDIDRFFPACDGYIAIGVGNGGAQAMTFPSLVLEIKNLDRAPTVGSSGYPDSSDQRDRSSRSFRSCSFQPSRAFRALSSSLRPAAAAALSASLAILCAASPALKAAEFLSCSSRLRSASRWLWL
jgi:hypothetical protein